MKVSWREWSAKDGEAEICFSGHVALVSVYFGTGSPAFHIGVRPKERHAYICDIRGNTDEHLVQGRWIWGRAVEVYDFCLEYFGLGPLLLICWEPR